MKFSVCWRKLIAESKFGFSRTIGSAGVKLCPERSCQAQMPVPLLTCCTRGKCSPRWLKLGPPQCCTYLLGLSDTVNILVTITKSSPISLPKFSAIINMEAEIYRRKEHCDMRNFLLKNGRKLAYYNCYLSSQTLH